MNADGIVLRDLDRWSDCQGLAETTLLRLCLLRELMKSLHTEKSKYLAQGLRAEVQMIKNWEIKLDQLRENSSLHEDLSTLLEQPVATTRKKRIIPEGLYQVLDRDKLSRYDRKWEVNITAEAAALGWSFWTLDTWVEVAQIEAWENTLRKRLWPHGIILFVEAAPADKNAPSPSYTNEDHNWRGRWIILLHPQFSSPTDISLGMDSWPGFPRQAPSPPRWKMIYS